MHDSGGMGSGHHGGDFGGHHGGHMSSGVPDSQPGMFFAPADQRHQDPLDPLSPWRRRRPGVRRYRGPAFVAALVFRLAVLAFIIFVAIQVFHAH